MGCGRSKMEAGDGLRVVRRKVEEIRRRRFGHGGRLRKDSMVSTTGLLHHEEEEEDATTVTTEDASHEESPLGDHVCRHCRMPSSPPVDSGGVIHFPSSTMTTPPPVVEVERREAAETEAVAVAPGAETGVAQPEGDAGKLEDEGEREKVDAEKEGEEKQKKEEEQEKEEKDDAEKQGEEKQGKGEEEGEEEDKNEVVREGKAADEKKDDEDEGEKKEVEGAALLGRCTWQGEEQLPGSPSFRIYVRCSVRECSGDDDSVKECAAESGKTEGTENSGRNNNVDSCSSQESERKISKKHISKRFKTLTRGPSAVYGLLNVRSCYYGRHHHPHSNNTNSSSLVENPNTVHT